MIMMKRLLITWLSAIMSFTAIAQQSNTISFLGIPVDGSKAEMENRLRTEKGFFYEDNNWQEAGILTGNFNGYQVHVSISDYNGLVKRVMVSYPYMSETQVKILYNELFRQLSKNEKYVVNMFDSTGELNEDEDISYEISVNSKQYQNVFVYPPWETLKDYVKRIENVQNPDDLSQDEELMSFYNSTHKDGKEDSAAILFWILEHSEGHVWFTIVTGVNYGDYHIILFYDNKKNKANGEDL